MSGTDEEVKQVLRQCEPPLTLGSCILARPAVALVVQKALQYFEANRYYLSAWCIMPNHVHVVFTPAGNWELAKILHSWKSFTGNQINRLLLSKGSLWERESFDHLIRSAEQWERFVYYVEQNPVAAGLCREADSWPYGSAFAKKAGWKPAPQLEFTNPRHTPFVALRSRGELPHLEKELGTYFVTFRLLDAVILEAKGYGNE